MLTQIGSASGFVFFKSYVCLKTLLHSCKGNIASYHVATKWKANDF